MPRYSHAILCSTLLLASWAYASVNVAIPVSEPESSQPLVQTLLSFSLEQDRWPDWVGVDTRNQFTYNALQNYAHLTGVPPKIRVGANTEDRTTWSPTVTVVEAQFPTPNTITPYPEATKMAVGDKYYELSKWLPEGTHMVWGLNMGADNATNAVNMVKSVLKAFKSAAVQAAKVTLDMIEIGNEPDLFTKNGLRPSGWTVEEYVADWISLATPVAAAAGLIEGGTLSFQAASFAGTGFTPRQIFNLGILDSAPGKFITTISQHRYSAAFCNGGDFPLISFMNKATVRGNITMFSADVAATYTQGLAYILGETGSIACHGAPGVSNTAGAALWVIDHTLAAAALQIPEVYYHEGIGFKYNFIQPIALDRSTVDGSPLNPPQPPLVQPSYYAGILINTFVGRTGSARIVELNVPDENISGYAAYENGSLRRLVFVNLHAWVKSMEGTGERPSAHIDLNFTLDSVKSNLRKGSAQVLRLNIGYADDTQGLSWSGQSFETSDALPKGTPRPETIEVQDGVDIRATEAILISF